MQVVYSFDRGELEVIPGQLMDVFMDDRSLQTSAPQTHGQEEKK
jgi:hypothetical protein